MAMLCFHYCFAFVFFFGLSKRHDEAPCAQPPQPPSQERFWELNSIGWGMFLPWVSQLVTLWLWTSSILALATCFMYREASVLGLESWREKQRGALMSMLHPCWTLRATTHRLHCHLFQPFFDVAGWSSVKLWLHATPKGRGKLSGGEVVKVPLSLTLPGLTVCWSWHFPRQQEQTVMQMVTHCNYRWGLLSQSIGREPSCGNRWLGDLQYNPVECRRLEYGGIKLSSSFIILSCFIVVYFCFWGMVCRKDGKHLVLEVAVKVDLLEGHPFLWLIGL